MDRKKKITIGWRIYVDATDDDGTKVRLPVGIGDKPRCEASIWIDRKFGAVYTTRAAAERICRALARETSHAPVAYNPRPRRVVRWV